MEISFTENASDDLKYWKAQNESKMLQRIRSLIENIQQTPFKGIGKPEPLKHNYSGMWSRRITHTHRMVYEVKKIRNSNTFFKRSLLKKVSLPTPI